MSSIDFLYDAGLNSKLVDIRSSSGHKAAGGPAGRDHLFAAALLITKAFL